MWNGVHIESLCCREIARCNSRNTTLGVEANGLAVSVHSEQNRLMMRVTVAASLHKEHRPLPHIHPYHQLFRWRHLSYPVMLSGLHIMLGCNWTITGKFHDIHFYFHLVCLIAAWKSTVIKKFTNWPACADECDLDKSLQVTSNPFHLAYTHRHSWLFHLGYDCSHSQHMCWHHMV